VKKLWIVWLILVLLGGGNDWVSAVMTQRIIHAGDTPLASTCRVTQTDPMELTVSKCSFTTTGQARIVNVAKAIGSFVDQTLSDEMERLASGLQELHNKVLAGEVEYMPDNKRVRGWLKDKKGNIIDKAKTRVLSAEVVLTILAPGRWVVYLTGNPGIKLNVVLQLHSDPRPANFVEYIVMPFVVPVGTTDLSGIDIEVFTVRPGFPPAKGLFEK